MGEKLTHRQLFHRDQRADTPNCGGRVLLLAGGVVWVESLGRGCALLQCKRCLKLIVVSAGRVVCEYASPRPDAIYQEREAERASV